MVSVFSLWAPILVATVLVFIASSIIHIVLKYHATDFRKLDAQDSVMDALRPMGIPPGDYMFPFMSHEECKTPGFKDRMEKGPVAFMTVLPSAMPDMKKNLIQWFLYCLVVGLFAGYVASISVLPGTPYMTVFRVTSTVAFMGYGLALLQQSIWYSKDWVATAKSVADAAIYGLLTGGAFGWLWPQSL